jgi:hypothetical protein
MQDKIQKLKSLLPKLSAKDATFASDLIYSYKKYGKLTDKQEPWVDKMIVRAESPVVEAPKIEVGGFGGVVDLFKKAKQHLKYPRIVLACLGEKVIFSLAGPASKTPGFILVAGEGSYPNKKWFGRVSPHGVWEPSHSTSTEMREALQKLLTEFANDPARVAKKYGKLTGICCFCASPLTDPKSTAAGFGPVCAKHYGLEEQWKGAVKKLEEAEKVANVVASIQQHAQDKTAEQEEVKPPSGESVIASIHQQVADLQAATTAAKPSLEELGSTLTKHFLAQYDKAPRKQPMVETQPCSICRKHPVSDVLEGIQVCGACKAALVAS